MKQEVLRIKILKKQNGEVWGSGKINELKNLMILKIV